VEDVVNVLKYIQLNSMCVSQNELKANIQANGAAYPQLMGKLQHEMLNLPPKVWARCMELCALARLDDAKAAKVDEWIEALRCATCSKVGKACQCGGNNAKE
jgi:hypothetical protein